MSSKIKDGLFMGDIDAAQDADFLQLNGIRSIINCVPREVPNLFQQVLGINYTTIDLSEILHRPFFDLGNRDFVTIYQVIENALDRADSVLVHSLDGICRSPSVMIGYLMLKYCWGLDKAYEYVLSKRPDLKLHESYVDQLCNLEAQILKKYAHRAVESQVYEWNTATADDQSDELVLVHTFLNSAADQVDINGETGALITTRGSRRAKKLTWIDENVQMKKTHPSLIMRPERPPNNSYNDMLPANGWVDLVAPVPTLTGPKRSLQSLNNLASSANPAWASTTLPDVCSDEVSTPSTASVGDSSPQLLVTMRSFENGRASTLTGDRKPKLEEEMSLTSVSSSDIGDQHVEQVPSVPRYLRDTLSSRTARQQNHAAHSVYNRSVPSYSLSSYGSTQPVHPVDNNKKMFTKVSSDREVKSTRSSSKSAPRKGAKPTSTGTTRSSDARRDPLTGTQTRSTRGNTTSMMQDVSIRPQTMSQGRGIEIEDFLFSTKIGADRNNKMSTSSSMPSRRPANSANKTPSQATPMNPTAPKPRRRTVTTNSGSSSASYGQRNTTSRSSWR